MNKHIHYDYEIILYSKITLYDDIAKLRGVIAFYKNIDNF